MTGSARSFIHLLGRFQVVIGRQVIPASAWRLRTAATLVKLLALAPGYTLHREQLMDLLWPGADSAAAARNLRYSLYTARRLLAQAGDAAQLLQRERDVIMLGPLDLIWTDVRAFTEAVAAAWGSTDPTLYERASALYVGDLLPDDLYEDWVIGRRSALRASYLAVLSRLANLYQEQREFDLAIDVLRKLVDVEPADESAHVSLMRLYTHTGRRMQALEQYDQLAAILRRELDAEPEAATRELATAIRLGIEIIPGESLVQSNSPRPEDVRANRSGLPVPLDPLIGREQELAELRHLLAGTRLLTLVGAGGIGKTRLAMAAAHEVADAFPDGVVFVSLASVRDAHHVVAAIAQELDVREDGSTMLFERVTSYLSDRRLLLVLDNVEQVAEAGPSFTRILASAPLVRMLITSRTRLQLRGEQEYPVPPLRHPDPSAPLTFEALVAYPAVALFTRRAREVLPRFRITSANSTTIAEICHQLSGMPLAIELAAARSRLLTPQEILARLDRPLAILTGGPRDAPERQQTLENAIRWSHDLLQPSEQRLFRSLSVFASGWTVDAATFVGGYDAEPTVPDRALDRGQTILDGLAALFDASLVVRDEGETGEQRRFSMLEPIRAFAAHLLEENGESGAIHERHAQYFAELAKQTGAQLNGPQPRDWLRRIEIEQDNLRAALQWTIDTRATDLGLRIAGALWEFWNVHGNVSEGRWWLDALLAVSQSDRTPARAEALRGAAELARRQGVYDAATRLLDESLALWTFLQDDGGRARTLNSMGILAAVQSDHRCAHVYWEQSLALAERAANAASATRAQHNLGGLAMIQGDYDEARRRLEANLALQRRIGNRRGTAFALSNLGVVARWQGDHHRARDLLRESLAMFNSLGDVPQTAHLLKTLGHVARDTGDYLRARQCYAESITRSSKAGEKPELVDLVRHVGELTVAMGQMEIAARLFGAAEALRDSLGLTLGPRHLQVEYEHAVRQLNATLDAATLATTWAAGRCLTLDEAVECALATVRRRPGSSDMREGQHESPADGGSDLSHHGTSATTPAPLIPSSSPPNPDMQPRERE